MHAVLPPHRYEQAELTAAFTEVCLGKEGNPALVARLHANAKVSSRHLVLTVDEYRTMAGFDHANDLFIEHAVTLGTEALTGALQRAGIGPDELDVIVSTTITGIAVPSIEARIAQNVGLRPDVKRVPMFGLGCVAGAAGIARLNDYLVGHPDEVAALLSVELCSLTIQRDDRSVANLIACGLFGDGAAAVVATGAKPTRDRPAGARFAQPPLPRQPAHDGMGRRGERAEDRPGRPGADPRREVPGPRPSATSSLRTTLTVQDVGAWVSHPGGPKVIEAIENQLDLPGDPLELTWRSLDQIGNLSSSSVLHVLRDTLDKRQPTPGTPGVLMAMGPGFCSELVLLEW